MTDRGRDEQQLADRILAGIEARHAARIGADRYAEFRKLLRALALPIAGAPQATAWASSHSASDVKPTITASIQYCERTARRGSR